MGHNSRKVNANPGQPGLMSEKRRGTMMVGETMCKVGLDELVRVEDNCPRCGERRMDSLAWVDGNTVICETCGKMFTPESMED